MIILDYPLLAKLAALRHLSWIYQPYETLERIIPLPSQFMNTRVVHTY
eukprot:SAG31_NODE_1639_length_7669_cov_13.434082_1_plen_48_part_00